MTDQLTTSSVPAPTGQPDLQVIFNAAIELMPIGIWVVDQDSNIIYANTVGKHIWGDVRYVTAEEYGQYQAWTVPHNHPLAANDWAAVKALKEGVTTLNEELRIKTFDGKMKTILNSAIPIKDSQGQVIKCVVFNQDITNLRESEAALATSVQQLSEKVREAEMFKMAVDQAAEHIIITDSQGTILFANNGVAQVTGYTREEVIGTKAGKLWSKPMEPEFYREMWDVIKNQKKIFKGELINRRKSGQEYTAQTTISPILNEQGDVLFFLALERDVTKERQIDKAKTEFVSFASHQLRTPLTAVKWYSEMLLSGDAGELTERQRDFVKEVFDANAHMVQLVSALLNVSRIELGTFSVDPVPTDVHQLLEETLADLKVMIQTRSLTVTTELDQLPTVMVDQKLIKIVFENLLTNAFKYSQEKGEIVVKLKHLPANSQVNGRTLPAEAVYYEVTDHGIGIPAHQQPKIFDKLFRADNAIMHDTSGTGLGLYITQSIVCQSGG